MRKLVVALLLLVASATFAQAQTGAVVVATCPGAHYGGLFTGAFTVDSNGRECGAVSFSGSVTSRDSVVAKAIVVAQCGKQSLTAVLGQEHVTYMDSTGNFCTNATGGGGGGGTHDTIFNIQPGLRLDTLWHIRDTVLVKARVGDTLLAIASNLRLDTIGHIRDTVLAHANVYTPPADTLTVRPVQRSGDSLNVRGSFSASISTADTIITFKGCTIVNTCAIYVKVDSVPLTSGGSLDTIRQNKNVWQVDSVLRVDTVRYIAKSVDSLIYPLSAGRLKTADSIMFIPPGGYNDSTNLVVAVRNVDTSYTRPSDTIACQAGAKSAADSVTLPSHGGSLFFYVTSIFPGLTDTLAIAGGAVYDSLTTTNFGLPLWRIGPADSLGRVMLPFGGAWTFANPVKTNAAATATKFRLSAPGAGGYWNLCVAGYYR